MNHITYALKENIIKVANLKEDQYFQELLVHPPINLFEGKIITKKIKAAKQAKTKHTKSKIS